MKLIWVLVRLFQLLARPQPDGVTDILFKLGDVSVNFIAFSNYLASKY